MTSMKKIPKEAGKSAHHNDDFQDLTHGGQKSEVNTLSHSSWIKVSVIIDSGAVESAAQIGMESVAHRRSTRSPLVAGHTRSAFQEPRPSQCTIACSSCLHCQCVVSRSMVSIIVE